MKNISIILLLFAISTFTFCKDNEDAIDLSENLSDNSKIEPIHSLEAETSKNPNQIYLRWHNPDDKFLSTVEISYQIKGTDQISDTICIKAIPRSITLYTLNLPQYATYIINIVAVNQREIRSTATAIEVTPIKPEEIPEIEVADFLSIADTLMTSMLDNFLGGPRDVWRSFPNPTGPYWDGDALAWGQGAGFSAFAAIREASSNNELYKEKYSILDTRMLNSINKFKVVDSRNGMAGYSVYPADWNDRFFDDNVWIGLDMIDLYFLTQNQAYYDNAKVVWNLIMTGTDTDGGVFWQELPVKSTTKHACSTAPSSVLASKMYMATHETQYLDYAEKMYRFCIDKLQDKNDFLIQDHYRTDGTVQDWKFTYNSGQTIMAGVLLYNLTKEEHYLSEAQQIAEAMYKNWFTTFHSLVFNKDIGYINSDHTWFNAIALRGLIELYKVDGDRKYITAYEEMLSHAWMSPCRNKTYNILNYDSFKGEVTQTAWDILHVGATVEMFARLASLKSSEGVFN